MLCFVWNIKHICYSLQTLACRVIVHADDFNGNSYFLLSALFITASHKTRSTYFQLTQYAMPKVYSLKYDLFTHAMLRKFVKDL